MDLSTFTNFELQSVGKLDATLYFKASADVYSKIYPDIISTVNPEKVYHALVDDSTYEMEDFDDFVNSAEDHKIVQNLLHASNDGINFLFYKGQIIIRHFFSVYKDGGQSGLEVIKKYLERSANATVVLGFEQDLFLTEFEESLERSIKDRSLHPIIVITKESGKVSKQTFLDGDNEVMNMMLRALEKYVNLLSID